MTLNNRRFLRLAEYAAVSASVCGTVVAIATRQLLYAATPLSLALVLNLINRRQWEKHTEQSRLHQSRQLTEQLTQLQQETAQRDELETVQTTLQEIESLAIQKNFDRRPDFDALRTEIDQAIATAQTFTQEALNQLDVPTHLQQLESRLSQQQHDQIDTLRQATIDQAARQRTEVTTIQAKLQNLQTSLAQIESLNLPDNFVQTAQFEFAQANLAEIQNTVAQLQQQQAGIQQDLDRRPDFDTLRTEINQAIATAQTFTQETLKRLDMPARLQQLESRLSQQQRSQIASLRQSTIEQAAAQQTEVTTIQANLKKLQTSLAQIESLNLPDNFVQIARFESLQANLAEMQDAMAQLQQNQTDASGHLEDVINRITADYQQISQTQTKITDDIAAVNQQIDTARITPISPPESFTPSVRSLLPKPEYPPKSIEPRPLPFEPIASKPTISKPTTPKYVPQLPITAQETSVDYEINLGIDFGTGFTKVCYRDLARDNSEIVTFADTADVATLPLEQVLLPTKVVLLEDGTLRSGLTAAEWKSQTQAAQHSLEYIKMRLAHLDLPEQPEWRLEQIPLLNQAETVENVCAFYLSTVIERAQTWIRQHRPDLSSDSRIGWSFNMGVPVEYCDSASLRRFQRVLCMAWLMVNTPFSRRTLSLTELNQLGRDLRDWMVTHLSEDFAELDCFTTPEISAAVWSFLSSRQAVEKFYTFFDFGDGTLDGTAFRFWRENDGDLKVDFYTGQVKPLGVSAFTQQTATELNISPETVHQAIVEWAMARTPQAMDELHTDMLKSRPRRSIQRLVGSVVMDGNATHGKNRGVAIAKCELGEQLDIFVGGGGGHNPFLQSTVQSTYEAFGQDRAGIPPYRIQRIPQPADLQMNHLNSNEFHRFAVAYGLAIPSWEGPEIRLPSQIEVNIEEPVDNPDLEPPRYDDMRGSW